MKFPNSLISIICLLGISGCASMSKSECANANWQTRGFSDGQNGSTLPLLSRHTKACSKIGVYPDELQYRIGHSEGVKLYCTPKNGLKQGRSGADYYDVCPIELESAFLQSHIDGLQIKLLELEREHNFAERELFTLRFLLMTSEEKDKRDINSDIDTLETTLSRNQSQQLSIQTRISEYRLRIRRNI